MRHLFLIFILVFSGYFLWSDESFKAQINLNNPNIFIDEELEVEVLLTYPANYTPDYMTLKKNTSWNSDFYGPYFFLKQMNIGEPSVDEENPGHIKTKVVLKLQPIRKGEDFFTLYNIDFEEKGSKKRQSVITKFYPITITEKKITDNFQTKLSPLMTFSKDYSLQLDSENQNNIDNFSYFERLKEEDIRLMKEKSLPWHEMLVTLLIGFLLWVFVKHPVQKVKESDEKKKEKAKVKLLNAIERFRNSKDRAVSYTELVEPLTEFIATKYSIPLKTVTTFEFLKEIKQNEHFSLDNIDELKKILFTAEKVKFAKYQPNLEEFKELDTVAFEFSKR